MKNKGSTSILVITVMLLAVALTMACLALVMKFGGYEVSRIATPEPSDLSANEDRAISKVEEIDKLISESYLKSYDRDAQMEDVYRAMLNSLDDPYSRYLNEEELRQLQQDINSSFTGTGIVFVTTSNDGSDGSSDKKEFLITEVIAGGPADVAGIKEGDIILRVDDEEYSESEELITALKGDPGTTVELEVMRESSEYKFSLIRGDVTGVSVDSKSINGENIGYIRIRSFGTDTYDLFDSAISGFEKGNADGVVIDLRDNPGGLFDEGIRVADRILPECLVAYTIDKAGTRENYNSDSMGSSLKMVVLINENTASTAEMLAAAIKETGAGKLVGVKSYGKGLIQETHAYDDGSAVNLTTKEFFACEGVKIDGTGVSPDIRVYAGSSSTTDKQLEEAIKIISD